MRLHRTTNKGFPLGPQRAAQAPSGMVTLVTHVNPETHQPLRMRPRETQRPLTKNKKFVARKPQQNPLIHPARCARRVSNAQHRPFYGAAIL
jgi:hypothetical protein